jgi:hypothetical protein
LIDRDSGPSTYAARVTLAAAALLGLLVAAVMLRADGHLVYALDDPYIHLALGESILRGGYGVNIGEYSSPSSSILYPFLMAGAQALGLGAAGPLAVDALAALASVFVAGRFLKSRCLGPARTWGQQAFGYACGLLLIFCLSAVALPLTGLEHPIHVLLVALVVDGLARVLDGTRPSAGLVAATILLPLIRFEGMALAGAVVIALAWLGRWRTAGAIGAAILGLLGLYFLFMLRLGLPLMPSSVMVKSPLTAAVMDSGGAAKVLAFLVGGLLTSLKSKQGEVLILLVAGLALGLAVSPKGERRRNAVMAATAGAALFAHLLVGQYNWFHRYEVYANVIGVMALLYVFRTRIGQAVERGALLGQALTLGMLSIVGVAYVNAAIITPASARGIYDEQYQLHRFAAEVYGRPVAVNDLGLVSYRNTSGVLDLWGLGSERVRKLRAAGAFGPAQMARMARDYGVGVVMIYEPWFDGQVPAEWRKAAVLHALGAQASCDNVTFFVTPIANDALVLDRLARFKAMLPARDTLHIGGDFAPPPCKGPVVFQRGAR